MIPHAQKTRFASLRRFVPVFLLLAALGGLCFGNSLKNPLLNWDDHVYIQNNPYIRKCSWNNLKSLFTRPYFKNYAPLHILSYNLDYLLWKFNPAGYRIINLLLHILNGFFIFILVKKWYHLDIPAIIGATLFLVHPVQVESVVWLSQRKTVLAAFLFFLSLYGYLQYKEHCGRFWYLCSLTFFTMSLLTKPAVITLPFLLLLHDRCFSKERARTSIREKIPFFLLAGFAAIATIWAQSADSGIKQYTGNSFFLSLFLTGKIIVLYLLKLLFPIGLSARYVFSIQGPSDLLRVSFILSWMALLLLTGVLLWLWFKSPSRSFPGWWFLVTLLPVANLIPTSTQMADRYLYLPSFGYCLAVGLLIHELTIHSKPRIGDASIHITGFLLIGGLIMTYGFLTLARNRVWRSDYALWEDALQADPNNHYAVTYLAHAYLTDAQRQRRNPLQRDGHLQKAKKLFQQGIRLNQTFAPALLGMGNVLLEEEKPREAIPYLLKAQEHNDEKRQYLRIQHNLGVAHLKTGHLKAAEKAFLSAIEEDQTFTLPYLSLGNLFFGLKTPEGYQRAAEQYLKVIELSPEDPRGYYYLALVRELLGNLPSAGNNYKEALRLIPEDPSLLNPADIHFGLGRISYGRRNYSEALTHFRQALLIDPSHPQAQAVRSIILSLSQSLGQR
ncbi:MAG: tetratricopeptide repeat protein [bacterium]